jgi:hypothetical protein
MGIVADSAAGRGDRRRLAHRPARDPAPWASAVRAAIAALAILFIAIPAPAAGQVIRGRVVDAASGAAVPLARVAVTGTGQRTRATTAADGRFAVTLRRGGSFRVQVTRTGYAQGTTRSVSVGSGDTVDVVVRLPTAPHLLDPVTVTGRPRRIKLVGRFYETLDSVTARVRAVGQARGIRAFGSIPAPGECHQLSGNAERMGSIITLTVQGRPRSEPCDPLTGGFAYDVTLRTLPPGIYTLRVIHAFQNEVRPPAMALDTTVTVP